MSEAIQTMEEYEKSIQFPIGEPNTAFEQYFIGQSYLAVLITFCVVEMYMRHFQQVLQMLRHMVYF